MGLREILQLTQDISLVINLNKGQIMIIYMILFTFIIILSTFFILSFQLNTEKIKSSFSVKYNSNNSISDQVSKGLESRMEVIDEQERNDTS